jgi:hypothetical protein
VGWPVAVGHCRYPSMRTDLRGGSWYTAHVVGRRWRSRRHLADAIRSVRHPNTACEPLNATYPDARTADLTSHWAHRTRWLGRAAASCTQKSCPLSRRAISLPHGRSTPSDNSGPSLQGYETRRLPPGTLARPWPASGRQGVFSVLQQLCHSCYTSEQARQA